jgi:hypothetical protein
MATFRKKPVVIEAVQFVETTKSVLEIYKFVHGEESVVLKSSLDHDKFDNYADAIIKNGFDILTLEGTLKVLPTDWIIKGYTSKLGTHFWPVKSDYFTENYEEVE